MMGYQQLVKSPKKLNCIDLIIKIDTKSAQQIQNNQYGTQFSQQFTQYPVNFPHQQTTDYGGSYGPGQGPFNPFQPFLQQSFQSVMTTFILF